MKTPQFTMRDLLLSVALIAIGLGLPNLAYQVGKRAYRTDWDIVIYLGVWFTAASLVGAGLLLPFGKTGVGAMLGPPMLIALFFVYAIIAVYLA